MESIACFVAASQSLVRKSVTLKLLSKLPSILIGPVVASRSLVPATLSVHSGVGNFATFARAPSMKRAFAKLACDATQVVAESCRSQHLCVSVMKSRGRVFLSQAVRCVTMSCHCRAV